MVELDRTATELRERLAAVETHVQIMEATLAEIRDKQDKLVQELARYRGAMGMLMLGFSAIWSVLLLIKGWLIPSKS